MLQLNENDWLKLRDYNKVIATRIMMRLPSDWCLTSDEVEGAVYDTFIKLLNNYKDGAMSPTSYCYQFGEKWTYQTLMSEYHRLKKQDILDALYGEDKDDDEPCRHKYGEGDVATLTVDEREKRDSAISVKEILDKMPKLDQMIAEQIMEGHSYDEIAKSLGIDRKTAMRRMKKYHGSI